MAEGADEAAELEAEVDMPKEMKPEFEAGTRRLPLDSLTADWITNVRADPGDVSGLAESIRRNGLQNPIVVRPSPRTPGMFEVIEGSRRVAAYRLLAQSESSYKKIPTRVIQHCDDAHAVVLSFDENDKRGNLTARELGSYIEVLKRSSPHDPASDKTLKYVAESLGWFIDRVNKKGKTVHYPHVTRVKEAIRDAEFQEVVPDVEIKVRSRGDIHKPTVPLAVAREARQAVLAARERLNGDAGSSKRLGEFLLAYARAAPPKIRRLFRQRFVEDPTRPVKEILAEVEREAIAPPLEQLVGTKVTVDVLNRVDDWQHAQGHEGWTRSDAVRDLLMRGISTLK